jgi:hypothetical protein
MPANNATAKARLRLRGATKKLGLKKQCPKGYTLRAPFKRGYTKTVKESGYNVKRGNKTVRIYPTQGSVLVKASCIKERGSPKKKGLIGPLKEGELTRFGYNAHKSRDERHKALKKAIDAYGPLNVYHKLDAVAKLTVRTAPDAHIVFVADRAWVQKNYTMRKNA